MGIAKRSPLGVAGAAAPTLLQRRPVSGGARFHRQGLQLLESRTPPPRGEVARKASASRTRKKAPSSEAALLGATGGVASGGFGGAQAAGPGPGFGGSRVRSQDASRFHNPEADGFAAIDETIEWPGHGVGR